MRDKIIAILTSSDKPLTSYDLEAELNLIDVDEVDELHKNLDELVYDNIIEKSDNLYSIVKKQNNKVEIEDTVSDETESIDLNEEKNNKKAFKLFGLSLKKKTFALIALILGLILAFSVSSYAWLSATNGSDKISTLTSGNLSLNLADTKSLTLANSYPLSDVKGLASDPYTFTIKNTGTIASSYVVYLKDNALSDGKTRIADNKVKYSLIKNKNVTTGAKLLSTLASVDGKGRVLATGTIDPDETINFDVRIWIDEAAGSEVEGTSFSAKISMEGEQLSVTPNEPNISDGMIPVVYDEASSSFVKADGTVTDNWYNYTNKNWANIALINDSAYVTTLNNSPIGTKIDASKVAGYFVWIPRMSYSYKVLPFSVKFINKSTTEDGDSLYTGATPENFYTSDAFHFDSDLDGFYISKYEATGTTTAATSLPGAASLRSANVSTLYNSASNMKTLLNYTLSGDIHMVKNSEWETAAILAESSYGLNGAITKNANASYITAQGGSTTGNTSGIYDMVGGTSEYVMGLYNSAVSGSGFTTLPDSKYYDNYTDDDIKNTPFSITKGLQSGAYNTPNSTSSFIVRGDSVADSTSSIFTMNSATGAANANYGTRIVITN